MPSPSGDRVVLQQEFGPALRITFWACVAALMGVPALAIWRTAARGESWVYILVAFSCVGAVLLLPRWVLMTTSTVLRDGRLRFGWSGWLPASRVAAVEPVVGVAGRWVVQVTLDDGKRLDALAGTRKRAHRNAQVLTEWLRSSGGLTRPQQVPEPAAAPVSWWRDYSVPLVLVGLTLALAAEHLLVHLAAWTWIPALLGLAAAAYWAWRVLRWRRRGRPNRPGLAPWSAVITAAFSYLVGAAEVGAGLSHWPSIVGVVIGPSLVTIAGLVIQRWLQGRESRKAPGRAPGMAQDTQDTQDTGELP